MHHENHRATPALLNASLLQTGVNVHLKQWDPVEHARASHADDDIQVFLFSGGQNFIHQQYADVFKTPLTRKVSFLYGSTTKEL
jgi:hypothetical protein